MAHFAELDETNTVIRVIGISNNELLDENGNEVVITAEVAVALELLTSAADIVSAIFESPGELLFALGNLGADMSPEEREEASKTIIAATIVGNIATTTMATAIGSIGYRRPN